MNSMRVKSAKTKCLYKLQKVVMLSCQSLIGLHKMSLMFKNLDFDLGTEELDEDQEQEQISSNEVVGKTTDEIIEQEALQYIGRCIVRKFSMKYPHFGSKASTSHTENKTLIEMVNRSELYLHSNEFISHLTIMREVFNAIHGKSLI